MADAITTMPPFEIVAPVGPRTPLVVASPHSGAWYPDDFVEESRLDRLALRRSEDSFVHEIFAGAPAAGAPLLHAMFPRAYVDLNREPYELDPVMFEDELPNFVNCASPRVAVGLGTIARVVAEGEFIYRRKLRFAEVEARIEQLYRPYHAALEELVASTVEQFGACTLLDVHSMPSSGLVSTGVRRVADFVLGDRLGTSCDAAVTREAERVLKQLGYSVMLNTPYAGGFTTRHYGKPELKRHCLQIEINRSIYMDERSFDRKPYFDTLCGDMAALVGALVQLELDPAKPV